MCRWMDRVTMLGLLICVTSLFQSAVGHGRMVTPVPRQPEPLYWYQVGCMIGCNCSGGGKENYPSLASVGCSNPAQPGNTKATGLTWNIGHLSPQGAWNKYMPWRAPGSAKPIDSCGIASGFKPTAGVQYPHKFRSTDIVQGMKGTELPRGQLTTWTAGATEEASFTLIVNHGGGYQYRVCPVESTANEDCFAANALTFADDRSTVRYLDAAGQLDGDEINIAATDVTEGVNPAGKAWRRLPMPACNCDLGADCSGGTSDQFRSAYSKSAAFHDCSTGMQFEAQHLKDGTWPEGYGYFLSGLKPGNLDGKRGYGTKDDNDKQMSGNGKQMSGNYTINWVAGFSAPEARTMLAKAGENLTFEWSGNNHNVYKMPDADSLASCTFTDAVQEGTGNTGPVHVQIPENAALGSKLFFACQVGTHCQSGQHLTVTIANETSSSMKESKGSSSAQDEDACLKISKEPACIEEPGCKWHGKGQCYNPSYWEDKKGGSKQSSGKGADFSGAGTEDKDATWVVVDKVIAPAEPGDYLLQWRWDNEQTPQIWTTCADITVVPGATSSSEAKTLLPALGVLAGMLCSFLNL